MFDYNHSNISHSFIGEHTMTSAIRFRINKLAERGMTMILPVYSECKSMFLIAWLLHMEILMKVHAMLWSH